MSFAQAIEEIKSGKGMRLPFWGPGTVIRVNGFKKDGTPILYKYPGQSNGCVPWQATMVETFSTNWEVVD